MNDVKTKYGINNKVVRASEKTEDGRVVNTKAYNCWKNMMNRCYNEKLGINHRSRVCDEWKVFENFKKWYDAHYYEGAELDKDWNGYHCHYYSPETCVFMPRELNLYLKDKCVSERDYTFKNGKYIAQCYMGGRQRYLGRYTDLQDCIEAVITARRSYALGVADRLRIDSEYLGKTLISEEAYNAVVRHKWA